MKTIPSTNLLLFSFFFIIILPLEAQWLPTGTSNIHYSLGKVLINQTTPGIGPGNLHVTNRIDINSDATNARLGMRAPNSNWALFTMDNDKFSFISTRKLYFGTNLFPEAFTIFNQNGYVGIGLQVPRERFHVHESSSAQNYLRVTNDATGFNTNDGFSIGLDDNANAHLSIYESADLRFGTSAQERMRITADGKVGIGTTAIPAGYMLAVAGDVISEKVKVQTQSQWSDYVFEPDYSLLPLNELSEYISKHRHLPEVPSAEEVAKEGYDLGDMDATLLKKIEELTLYLLEQEKKIEAQSQLLKTLVSENEKLKSVIDKIEEERK